MRTFLAAAVALAALARAAPAGPGDREEKVRRDRERVTAEGFWIYGDLEEGRRRARETGRPLAVALRCIPCEECVKLDDGLVDADPRLRPLLERFVRVRLVSTNGLDLSTFQFDTDQSFAVFLLRADGAIYGRYGTRSDRTEWSGDVSIEGLAAALEGALALHEAWPRDQEALARKRGPAPTVPTPEAYPSLKGRYGPTLAREGPVVPSCVHCHQIGEAERALGLERGGLSEELLFPFPHPKGVGLILDPRRRATVLEVRPGSAAAAAGFEAGDEIASLQGQPLLSLADVQWVLHHTSAGGGAIEARVQRAGAPRTLTLRLDPGWRRADDLSWRASTWLLRRHALGGLKLEALSAAERARLPAAHRERAQLKVAHVGAYAPHDRAKKAGFEKGDVLLAFDGEPVSPTSALARETDVLAYALGVARRQPSVRVELLRSGEPRTLTLPKGP